MPKLRIFLAVGVALSAASLSACTSTGNGVSPDLALNSAAPVEDEQSADFPLPETVAVLPTAYAPVEGAPVPLVAEATQAPADGAALVAEAVLPEGTLPPPSRPGDPVAATQAQQQPAAVQVASLAPVAPPSAYATPEAGHSSNVDQLIAKYAAVYEVPVDLVRRVVKRESNFYPGAYNKGHWGLMQIKHSTARGLGYDGPPNGLLDPETNLKYAVKYLRGALLVADGDHARADRLYQRGYYYDAKRKGLLTETGMGTDRHRMRSKEEVAALAQPQVEFPPVAEVIPASVQGEFPPAPAAPDATPVPAALGATPAAASPSADMPVITPATAPVPTAAPAAATAGA